MRATTQWRDYSLTGLESSKAIAYEDWYSCPIPRKRLKQLMKRSDKPALLNYGLWLMLLVVSGFIAYLSWGTWWALPAFFVYGVLYASCADSRWHECAHGTVFRSRWLNEVFYHLASFMALKNAYLWRWSHTRHHTHTLIVGRDPEIAFPRPPSMLALVSNLLYLKTGPIELSKIFRHSLALFNAAEQEFVPESERDKVVWTARAYIAILIGVIVWSIASQSWLPLMFIGLSTFYGQWLHHIMAATQHAGLAEDVPDHRLNSRTVYLNPVLRFIYSNMNYHVEHHMFPTVPFYALPTLHEAIKNDCPAAYPSLFAAFREMIPALLKQRQDPNHYVPRKLPPTAQPSPLLAA